VVFEVIDLPEEILKHLHVVLGIRFLNVLVPVQDIERVDGMCSTKLRSRRRTGHGYVAG
jgi:hypothetical protein